jgi:signal transduction histidine kinase/CheY-like chemotaxis protein/ligand-binding sensor domain-containing protein
VLRKLNLLNIRRFRRRLYCVLFTCTLLCVQASAEDRRFGPRMQRYTTSNGLPSNAIIGLALDQKRYLWIATERGVVRFDGAKFTPIDPAAGIPDVSAETLFVDQSDRVWLGLTDHGMCALSVDRIHSTCFAAASIGKHHIPGNDVFAVSEFGGRIWLAVFDTGLVEVDAQTLDIIKIHALNNADIVAAATSKSATYFASFSGSISSIEIRDGKPFLQQDVLKLTPPVLSLNVVDDSLWLGLGRGQGAIKIALNESGASGQFAAGGITTFEQTPVALAGTQTVVAIGRQNDAMVFATERGLVKLKAGEMQSIRAIPGAENALPEGLLMALATDHEDGLWIGSVGSGLAHWNAQNTARGWLERGEGGLPGSRVNGASPAANGVIWVSLYDSGIVGVYPDGTVQRLPVDVALDSNSGHPGIGLPSRLTRTVLALGQGKNEHVWIGHQRGLTRYSPYSKQFVHWASNGPGKIVDLLTPNQQGGVWLASERSELFELDQNLTVLTHADDQVTGGNIEQIMVIDGTILLAGKGGLRELKKVLGTQLRISRQPITEPVYALALCGDTLWLALAKQLVALNSVTFVAQRRLARPAGFASDIGGMACAAGALWLAGPGGLWRLADGAIDAQRVTEGINQIELSEYPFQTLDQAFLIGSTNGLLRFEPRRDATVGKPFPLWLNDAHNHQPLREHINLPWRNPLFAIEAHALSYTAPTEVQFQFQLNRLGSSSMPEAKFSNDRNFNFSGLSPGDYQLITRARNSQGLTARAPTIAISLPTPPWLRWYSMLASTVALLAIVSMGSIWLTKRRLQRKVRQNLRQEALTHSQQIALARTETLGYISHEMRNLLNGVTGNAELLQRGVDAEHQLKLTARIVQSGEALAQLLDDALDHTQLVVRRLEIHPANFDLAELLFDALESQRAGAHAKGLRLETEFVDVERSCESDPGRVRQILVNLLSNAVKFTEHGWVRFSAHYRGGRLLVSVSDSGPGIGDTAQSDIFKPYVRLNRAARGSGLGLAICAELSHALGGELRFNTPTSQLGSQFDLSLPLATVATLGEQFAQTMPHLTILVVEDEPDNQLVIGELLRTAGHNVHIAGDSFGALTATAATRFDVVLMDLDLDGSSGLDLAQILAAQPNMRRDTGDHVPIVALSGRASLSDRVACAQAGMHQHIAKPYRIKLIHAAIRRALDLDAVA